MEFKFPDTGEGVTEGQFLKWLVDEGEEVEEDQAVAEVETDKAVVDVPAPANGTIDQLKAEPGDVVKVGEVIMVLNTGGGAVKEQEEDTEEEASEPEQKEENVEESKEPAKQVSSSSSGNVLALPKVRKAARDKGIDLASIATGRRITMDELDGGKPATADDEANVAGPEETHAQSQVEQEAPTDIDYSDVQATPSVRQLAREKGINITTVEGSGRGGKITRDDILNYSESDSQQRQSDNVIQSSDQSEPAGPTQRIPMSNIRRVTAERMTESRFTAPHVTHVEKADITELADIREREKEKVDAHLTYLPFVMKALTAALQKYPDLNAEVDMENKEIIRYNTYDFNIAVDTDEGLLVPKIADVGEKSIVRLADEIVEKAGKAKEGSLNSEEMSNGTFSITNLGVIGGEEFTPIINYPQVAILGIGRIGETAEVVDGEIVPRTTVKLSLSYDHRAVDGATAARFMNELVENLEDPNKMFLSL